MPLSTRLLIVVTLLTSCSAPSSTGQPEHPATFPATEEVEALRLPFDGYTLSVAELYTLANAEELLTRVCMETRGYDWEMVERPTDLADLRNRRRYGVIENAIALQFGYHVPAGLITPLDVEQRLDRRDNALTDGQKAAAFDEGGCMREAVRGLQPDESPDLDLLQRLSRASLDDSQDEAQVAQSMRSWRDCMRDMGLDYQDPFEAMSDSKWWAESSVGPSNQETTVAVADVECKGRTNLVTLWHASEMRFQEEAIERYPDYFHDLRAAKEQHLAAAETVLSAWS